MLDVTDKKHNPTVERIVEIINQRTGNQDKNYFRVVTAHTLMTMASTMRANVLTHDNQLIPVNSYAMALGASGYSKGFSLGILENELTNEFSAKFMDEFLPVLAEIKLLRIAQRRANRNASDPDEELEKVQKEYEGCGEYLFSFSEGTAPALKQMRHKLLMCEAGALNFVMDELGYNLQANADMLKTYLELYDMGLVKEKLIKNSTDNKRNAPIRGKTPANVLMFGVPSAVFDGGKVEDDTFSFLESGYGRRTIFAYGDKAIDHDLTIDQMYDQMVDQSCHQDLIKLSKQFGKMVCNAHYNQTITMSVEVAKLLLSYKKACNDFAANLPEHETIRAAELQHRHFKCMKYAAGFAWIEGNSEISVDNFWQAVKLVEESGKSFQKILVRERNYEKLAKYLATVSKEVTYVDMMEDLPFFKGATGKLAEMVHLAIAYGHKNHIIIKKSYQDGIEFIQGEALQETNLDKLIFSHSADWTTGFMNQEIPFHKLADLTQIVNPNGDYNWITHHFVDGHRKTDNMIQGFNMIVIDCDGDISMKEAKALLQEYTYHLHETKRSTSEVNRFRVVLPISHHVKLNDKEFKQFMDNVFAWLPWETSDRGSNQVAKKWLTHKGTHFSNEAETLDARQFIPNTRKDDERQKSLKDTASLSRLERWFAIRCTEGQRSNEMIKYAYMLADSGMGYPDIEKAVLAMNSKLKDALPTTEIHATILKSVATRCSK